MDLLDRLRIDVPVCQAGMGGGLAGAELATSVARAGALGTLGWLPARGLRESIRRVRDGAGDRAIAVNFLMPFVSRRGVDVCVKSRIDVAVIAFGGDRPLVQRLTDAKVFVLVMVGTVEQARRAVHWGADGLIAQSGEAGGHLSGDGAASDVLPDVLAVAGGRPVLLAGGMADADDSRRALAAGADAVVAGTRFLLTHESGAHLEYQQRILAAVRTFRTTLFGFGWPLAHRVVANAATERWCHRDGTAKRPVDLINARSGVVTKLGDVGPESIVRLQRPSVPLFTPSAPTKDMPDSFVDRAALYAGESVLRMNSVVSAREAVTALAP